MKKWMSKGAKLLALALVIGPPLCAAIITIYRSLPPRNSLPVDFEQTETGIVFFVDKDDYFYGLKTYGQNLESVAVYDQNGDLIRQADLGGGEEPIREIHMPFTAADRSAQLQMLVNTEKEGAMEVWGLLQYKEEEQLLSVKIYGLDGYWIREFPCQ